MIERQKITTAFGIFAFLFMALPRAQAMVHSLDLEDVFHAALHKSELVQEQGELVYQAKENYKQAVGSILPSINGTAFYFDQQQPPIVNSFITASQEQVKLTGDQPLFRGFREFAGLQQTKLTIKAQEQNKKESMVQLYQSVIVDFYQVLAAQRDIQDLKEESKLYQQRIAELEHWVKIGRSRPAEVTQIQSSLESLYATLEASKDQLSTARKTFKFLTGLPARTPIVDPFPEDFNPGIGSLDQYISAIDRRPEVQSYRLQRDAANEAISVAKGANLPSVDLTGDYYAFRSGGFPGGTWDFQLTLTLPIFAGGTIESKVRQAASVYRQNELSLSRGQRLADQEISTYHSRVQLDHAQVSTLKKAKQFAWTNFQQETRDYRLGLVTNLDVLQSLTSFVEAERTLDRSKFQEKTDYLYLLSASGKVKDPAVAY